MHRRTPHRPNGFTPRHEIEDADAFLTEDLLFWLMQALAAVALAVLIVVA